MIDELNGARRDRARESTLNELAAARRDMLASVARQFDALELFIEESARLANQTLIPRALLSRRDAAKYIQKSCSTFDMLVKSGIIKPKHQPGSAHRKMQMYDPADLDDYRMGRCA